MRSFIHKFSRDEAGSVTVETSLVLMFMIAFTGAGVEAGYAFWQWNGAQEAARVGARIAATSDPVAKGLSSMTGLSGNTNPGDPMPDYTFSCTGQGTSCNSGQYDGQAMAKLVYGPDGDDTCGKTERERRGMCDVFSLVEPNNVEVDYRSSGLGTAGSPADPAPLITITVTNMKFNFVFLDIFAPESLAIMPDVTVTVMSEDLKSGA